jgi:hypothetical protein
MRYIIIGLATMIIAWLFLSRPALPRDLARIEEDFTLAKNRWAAGGWTKDDATNFLDRLHQDAIKGSRTDRDLARRKEAKALANQIVQWTLANLR